MEENIEKLNSDIHDLIIDQYGLDNNSEDLAYKIKRRVELFLKSHIELK